MATRKPYHFMETAIRITTAADISTGQGKMLADLLKVSEDVGGGIEGRHATNDLAIWVGNQDDPASVVVVCDRLIAALIQIRNRNVTPDLGDHHAYPTAAADPALA